MDGATTSFLLFTVKLGAPGFESLNKSTRLDVYLQEKGRYLPVSEKVETCFKYLKGVLFAL